MIKILQLKRFKTAQIDAKLNPDFLSKRIKLMVLKKTHLYSGQAFHLQIVTWFDDPTDTALLDLIPYLKGLAEAPSVLEYVSQFAPPPTAAKAQPDISPWLFGAPGLGGWGGYNDEDDEECETGADVDVYPPLRQEEDEELDSSSSSPSSSPHDIITMAPRPAGEAVTANT
ncbi:hypothetical protein ACTXT7_014245 [Hymenolepis weldensis]